MPPVVLDFEPRIAEDVKIGPTHGLGSASRTAQAMAVDAGEITEGCDVALQWVGAAADVSSNSRMARVVKRGWARSDGKRAAERVARFVSACEDEIDVPRSSRRLSREFFRSY